MSCFQKNKWYKVGRFFSHWWIIPEKVYCLLINKVVMKDKLPYIKDKKKAKDYLRVIYFSDLRILRTMRNLERISKDNWISIKDIFWEPNEIDNVHNEKEVETRLNVLFHREFVLIDTRSNSSRWALTSKYWMYFNVFKWCLHIVTGVIIITLSALILQWVGLSKTIVVEMIKTLG